MKVIGSCSWTWGVAPERVMMTRVYLPITTVQSHSSLYQGAVQNSPFCFCFCLFVVIKPENLYFASRLGLKVNPLWFYPLKYYWQHVPGKNEIRNARRNAIEDLHGRSSGLFSDEPLFENRPLMTIEEFILHSNDHFESHLLWNRV